MRASVPLLSRPTFDARRALVPLMRAPVPLLSRPTFGARRALVPLTRAPVALPSRPAARATVLAGLLLVLLVAAPAAGAGAMRHPARVELSIDAGRPGAVVPARFLGLSFEAASLPAVASYARRGNLVVLMRSLGAGVMRFGGNSVDATTAWSPDGRARPAWARHIVGPHDLDGIARLARATGWHVLLGVTLGHYDPFGAASEVAAAKVRLGGYLDAVEIGNEPDQFVAKGLRSAPWGYPQYRSEVNQYQRAIAAATPGVAFVGPDTASTKQLDWLSSYASDERPRELSVHYYPLTHCHATPTIGDLLSRAVRLQQTLTLGRLAAIAHQRGTALRLGETNSVSCSGQPGVSDSFGSALWATDYLTRLLAAGASGVNFHGLPGYCLGYSAVCAPTADDFHAGRLRAQPEWYALLLVRQLVGDRAIPVSLLPRSAALTVAAWRTPSGAFHLVIVNEGLRRLSLRIRVGRRFGGGTTLRLSAPSRSASTGVSLGGSTVAADGSWRTPARLPRVTEAHGVASVSVGPSSAALVTLAARR